MYQKTNKKKKSNLCLCDCELDSNGACAAPQCSVTCGDGMERRLVTCRAGDQCHGEKPEAVRPCRPGPCHGESSHAAKPGSDNEG